MTDDTSIGIETCEELFTPNSSAPIIYVIHGITSIQVTQVSLQFRPHIQLSLEGVEVFLNSSASHHELRKLHTRIELIEEATQKVRNI